jgi:hypothetical protein
MIVCLRVGSSVSSWEASHLISRLACLWAGVREVPPPVVVADAKRMAEIGAQHRKWAALEMEMYAMYEAATQSLFEPLFFGAKAVVDMGDAAKGDALHPTACTLSARFVVEVLRRKLPALIDA